MTRAYHVCPCGQGYSLDTWLRLPYVGVQSLEADETGPEQLLELRNCGCGSTMAVDVTVRRLRDVVPVLPAEVAHV